MPRGVQFPIAMTAAAGDVLAGNIHLTPDLEAELSYPAERQLYEAGFRSRLNLPLRVSTQVIGSLNLVWREVSGYTQANLPLLTQLVDAIALAVRRPACWTKRDGATPSWRRWRMPAARCCCRATRAV